MLFYKRLLTFIFGFENIPEDPQKYVVYFLFLSVLIIRIDSLENLTKMIG